MTDTLHISPEVAHAAASHRSESDARLARSLERFLRVIDREREEMLRGINGASAMKAAEVITASMGVIYTARDQLEREVGL